MFGYEAPLSWEVLPSFAPLAEYLRMISNQGAVKDFATMLMSFCPWAEEYPDAHAAIKEWLSFRYVTSGT